MTYETLIDKQNEIDSYVEEAKKLMNMYTVKMQETDDLKTDEVALFASSMAFAYKSLNLYAEMSKKLLSTYKDVIDIKEDVNKIEDQLWKLDLTKEEP